MGLIPDQAAGGWAALNGVEIINSQRTLDYIGNFGLPIQFSEGCWCPCIQGLLECGGGPYAGYGYPSTDQAPWYSDSIPESGDFLGFLPVEFEGLGSTYAREVFETINGGGVLGRLRPQPRTLTWRGLFFGRTACAAEYGLRWMTSRLAATVGCEGCSGGELDILYCCVDDPSEIGCTSETAPAIDDNMGNSDAFRAFYKVGLVDGPKKLSDRIIGCMGCTQKTTQPCSTGAPCPGGAAMIEAEFSLVAGNPFMHRDSITACEKTFVSAACGDCDAPTFDQWTKVGPGEPCSAPDCEQFADSTCLIDPENPECNPDDLPVIPEFVDPCTGCEPLEERTVCCEISDSLYGEFFDAALTVEVYSGALALRNIAIRIFENPQRRECDDQAAFDQCSVCDSLKIRYVPPFSTLRVDGLNRRIELECLGQEPQPAESLTITPFSFPILTCNPYLITASVDCARPTADDATFKVIVHPREM